MNNIILFIYCFSFCFFRSFNTNISYVDPSASQSDLTGTYANPFVSLKMAFELMSDLQNSIILKSSSGFFNENIEINQIESNFSIYPEGPISLTIFINDNFFLSIGQNATLDFKNLIFTSNNSVFTRFGFVTNNNSAILFRNCNFIDLDFSNQATPFLIWLSQKENSIKIFENLTFESIIFAPQINFIEIKMMNNIKISNVTMVNCFLNSSIFLKILSGSLNLDSIIFSKNSLNLQSFFFYIEASLLIANSYFQANDISNSTLMYITDLDSNLNEFSIDLTVFSENKCENSNDLSIYSLMIISIQETDFFMNDIVFRENFCKSPFILVNQTKKSVILKNIDFEENYSTKLIYFYMNFQLFLENTTIQYNNNANTRVKTSEVEIFLQEYAGSCFSFNSISNLSIMNCSFADSYSSILPTILFFEEEANQLSIMPSITIANTIFTRNFFNFSDFEYPQKYSGCSITSNSKSHVNVINCIFENNSFNIPNNPIKGGPGINIENLEAELMVLNCEFKKNKANFQSNSIFFQGLNITIISTFFNQNQEYSQINVKLAGGVFMIFNYAFIHDCVFEENRGYNGGVSISLGSFGFQYIMINSTKFLYNWASYTGAGVNIDETGVNRTCLIYNSHFLQNYADNYAAAVFIFGAGGTVYTNITFVSCIFDRNTAVWEGGAFSIWLYYPLYSIYFYDSVFNGSRLTGTGNSIMGACLDYWGDSSWIQTDSISILKTYNCVFNNSFSFTGSGLYIVSAFYYDFNSTFDSNYAEKEGGAILLSDKTQIFLNFTRILKSESLYSAGSIGGKEEAKLYLSNVFIAYSKSKSGSGIYLDANSLLFANNLTFYGNEGEVGSGILIRNTNDLINYINNTNFSNNVGSYSVIQIEYSTVYMENSFIGFSNVASFSTYSSILFLHNFIFQNNSCSDQITGCSFYIRESSNIFLFDSIMSFIYGSTVGAIYLEYSGIEITNTSFFDCVSLASGDILFSLYSKVVLKSIEIRNFQTSAIELQASELNLIESLINNEFHNITRSSISCLDCRSLLVSKTNFLKISSEGSGAGLNLQNSDINLVETQNLLITNCSFNILDSIQGGVFYLSNINITVSETYFVNSSAQNGGAIYFSCSEDFITKCMINITNNSFIENLAFVEGGAIKWTGKKPINIATNRFSKNQAKYGKNVASFPVRLGFSILTKDDVSVYDTLENYSAPIFLQNIQSGGKIPYNLRFYFLDENDETIRTISLDYLKLEIFSGNLNFPFTNSSIINITNDGFYDGNSSVIFGETFQIINSDTSDFLISDLTIIGRPTSVLYLQISTMYTEINAEFKNFKYKNNPNDFFQESTREYFFILPVILRECVPGEIYNSSDNKCVECVAGKYSFSPKESGNTSSPSQCLTCIQNAFCPGGYQISLLEGYWRKNIFSTTLYKCNLNSLSCLGGLNSSCDVGYAGSLCASCENNEKVTRSKNFMDVCQECPHLALGIIIELVLITILCSFTLLVYLVYRKKKFYNKQIMFLLKLLINYFQFIYVSGMFNVQLPIAIKIYISFFEFYTLIMRNWINSSCIFTQIGITEVPQYQHLIFSSFVLLLIFLLTFFVRKFALVKPTDCDSTRAQKVELFLTICYIFNGPLLFTALHLMKCVEIEGNVYLEGSPDYECYSVSHIMIFIFFSFPIILLFVIFFPLAIKLLYLRNGVQNIPFKYRKIWNIGYIRNSKKIYFEFFMLAVKYVLIGIIVFFGENNIKKAITCFFIMLSFTQSFLIIKPFKYKFFTKMSILAFGAISSVYLSLILYFSDSSSPNTRVIFVSIMLALNTFFAFSSIFYILTAKKKKKILRKESILDISYEMRFKAFKTFGSSFDKKERQSISNSIKNKNQEEEEKK